MKLQFPRETVCNCLHYSSFVVRVCWFVVELFCAFQPFLQFLDQALPVLARNLLNNGTLYRTLLLILRANWKGYPYLTAQDVRRTGLTYAGEFKVLMMLVLESYRSLIAQTTYFTQNSPLQPHVYLIMFERTCFHYKVIRPIIFTTWRTYFLWPIPNHILVFPPLKSTNVPNFHFLLSINKINQ